MTVADFLLGALRAQNDTAANAWLDEARERARGPLPQLLRVYTEASRALGKTPLHVLPEDATRCPELQGLSMYQWTTEDAARLLLLLTRHNESTPDDSDWEAAAVECFVQGDSREQQSWLRTVAALPAPKRFLTLVIDACRTSIVPLFEAVACENTYPAAYFPERNFNQLVLKALFNGIALNRIVGLASRLNPDLSRMARDYADERRAAGRSVPADIGMAMQDGSS